MTEDNAQGARPQRARKRRPGRPVVALTAKRSVPLRVWTTHAERQALAAKASRSHLPLAEFMRRAGLGKPVVVVEVPPVNVETRRELAAIGHHLNRIVRAVEAADGPTVPDDLRAVLADLRTQTNAVAMALATGEPVPATSPPRSDYEGAGEGRGPP